VRFSVRLALLGALAAAAIPSVAGALDPAFSSYWHDGKAELDGYRLTVERYGHTRRGRAVAIFVTEPFSRTKHVKLDDPSKVAGDEIGVLKLNLVCDFQTGIYDYHTMLSLFAAEADFRTVKTTFSSSEWCGQVYEELNSHGTKLSQRVASYFEGEAAERELDLPANAVQEDDLFILLRGLRGAYLGPGEKRTVPLLASPFYRRLAHRTTVWATATIERRARPETIQVPAGSFSVDVFEVRPDDGRSGRFDVERAYPHRIIRWSWMPAAGASPLGGTDAGELTGSTRLAYWRTHDPGDERLLQELGVAQGVR
jgi:hypothetical protein